MAMDPNKNFSGPATGAPDVCPSCGARASAGFRFCGHCGAALGAAGAPAPAARDAASGAAEAERRQVTVLFCDLARSTELSERLDPEEWRVVLGAYQEATTRVVESLDGHVAQFLGDGILVYFGYPQAHEDDPRRAVRAALAILDSLHGVNRDLSSRGLRLEARIGVHTGTVVVGRVGAGQRGDPLALGSAPNLGARLQSLAEPGQVLVSGVTQRLAGAFFDFEPLGLRSLRGVAEPVAVYRALAERPVASSADCADRESIPVVGRDGELALLREAAARAASSRGEAIFLIADAGVGKSRLVHALGETAREQGFEFLICRCSPYHAASPFHPLREIAGELFTIASGADRLQEVERAVAALGLAVAETVEAIGDLVGLSPGPGTGSGVSPVKLKERRLSALLAAFLDRARRRPGVFVVEDLHWADPSTLEFLDLLRRHVPSRRILLLLTARPGVDLSGSGSEVTQLLLRRLDDAHASTIVELVAAGRLSEEEIGDITRRADGVPLFLEELTKAHLEAGGRESTTGGSALGGEVPVTLQDSLNARLDRLGEAKEVAQLAAVLGRELDGDLLLAVSPWDEGRLRRGVERLIEADLLRQRGSWPGAVLTFKHALICDAAYAMLLKSERRKHHERAARALEQRFPERSARQPEVAARHFSLAGLAGEAIEWWLRAGEKALLQSANLEAVDHLHRGLAELEGLAAGPARDGVELRLLGTLNAALIASQGYVAPEVERANARKLELCGTLGDSRETFWVLLGVATYQVVRGELAAAGSTAGRLWELAEILEDDTLRGAASVANASAAYYQARHARAEEWLRVALDLDPVDDGSFLRQVGGDLGVTLRYTAGMLRWHLGRPDTARRHLEAAIEAARRLNHGFSIAAALRFKAELAQFAGEVAEVAATADEILDLSEALGFPIWAIQGQIFAGWARVAGGERGVALDGVVDRMEEALQVYRQTGTGLSAAYYCSLVAQGRSAQRRFGESAALLAEARLRMDRTGDRYWEPEILRLEGELALEPETGEASPEVAERAFRGALEAARIAGSKSLELRAALALGRLLSQRGEAPEARRVVAAIYQAYPEKAASRDLVEAREFLGG
jgi:class 3 adenylate cyclase/tetratricopeptide (TPR) repeat protein